MEVMILPKRNKFGKRFGFARFMEIEEERLFSVKLDNVIIDGKKIHANQPRFGRKSPTLGIEGWFDKTRVFKQELHGKGKAKATKFGGLRGPRSFLDVVNNTEAIAVDLMVKESMKLSFHLDPESVFRLKKAYVGKVVPRKSETVLSVISLQRERVCGLSGSQKLMNGRRRMLIMRELYGLEFMGYLATYGILSFLFGWIIRLSRSFVVTKTR
ncbi:unnamed protein product [Vicia faba]|uniref:Uncharacterized protein n=1 Tax=Vicia faba TaxID=3906 RepID=A0AAV1A9B8_VICFA|nr:unnamed protein product [Vicia faba]